MNRRGEPLRTWLKQANCFPVSLCGKCDRHHAAKLIFWLPGQKAPELNTDRRIPGSLIENTVLTLLAAGPQEYAAVSRYIGKHVAKTRAEHERLRVPVWRAIKRLTTTRRVRRDGNLLTATTERRGDAT